MLDFKNYIAEAPQMSPTLTKNAMRSMTNSFTRDNLTKHPETHKHLGGDYYYHKEGDTHQYFRKHDGNIKEISLVTRDHVHKVTDSGGGDVKHIHNFMKHHAETHGRIRSDATNTKGSKSMWIGLVKSKPTHKTFHVINTKTNKEHPVDHHTIDKESHKIWGDSDDHQHIRIEMRHKK